MSHPKLVETMSQVQQNPHKNVVEAVVNTALSAILDRSAKIAFLRTLGTYVFVKLQAYEGTPAAAMAAYSLGDHLVDPKKEQKKSKS